MNILEERVDELEAKIAFLELANQELSDLIYHQQQQIDNHLRRIARELESASDNQDTAEPVDQKPPHY